MATRGKRFHDDIVGSWDGIEMGRTRIDKKMELQRSEK